MWQNLSLRMLMNNNTLSGNNLARNSTKDFCKNVAWILSLFSYTIYENWKSLSFITYYCFRMSSKIYNGICFVSSSTIQRLWYNEIDRKSYLALHMAILSRIFEYKKNAWRLYAWHIKNQQVICVLRNFQRLFLYLTYLNWQFTCPPHKPSGLNFCTKQEKFYISNKIVFPRFIIISRLCETHIYISCGHEGLSRKLCTFCILL